MHGKVHLLKIQMKEKHVAYKYMQYFDHVLCTVMMLGFTYRKPVD